MELIFYLERSFAKEALSEKFLTQSIKQPINKSFKSTVEGTRTPLAIEPAVHPSRAEQVVGVTPTDSIGTRYAR